MLDFRFIGLVAHSFEQTGNFTFLTDGIFLVPPFSHVMLSEHRMLTVCKHSVCRVFTHPKLTVCGHSVCRVFTHPKLTVCGHLLSRVFTHPMLRVCEHLLLRVCQVCRCVRCVRCVRCQVLESVVKKLKNF